jgi:hypothetical protein
MQDEPVGQTAAKLDIPPIHPQTPTSTDDLLNRSAGLAGSVVGRGDHWCPLYAAVGSGPAHGRAFDVPNTALRMRRRADEGIANMFAIVGAEKGRSCEQSWERQSRIAESDGGRD